MMNHLVDACEGVDAAVFSGECLYVPEELAKLKEYVARWQRAIAAREQALALDPDA